MRRLKKLLLRWLLSFEPIRHRFLVSIYGYNPQEERERQEMLRYFRYKGNPDDPNDPGLREFGEAYEKKFRKNMRFKVLNEVLLAIAGIVLLFAVLGGLALLVR